MKSGRILSVTPDRLTTYPDALNLPMVSKLHCNMGKSTQYGTTALEHVRENWKGLVWKDTYFAQLQTPLEWETIVRSQTVS